MIFCFAIFEDLVKVMLGKEPNFEKNQEQVMGSTMDVSDHTASRDQSLHSPIHHWQKSVGSLRGGISLLFIADRCDYVINFIPGNRHLATGYD